MIFRTTMPNTFRPIRSAVALAALVASAACEGSPTEELPMKELPPPSVDVTAPTRTVAAGTPLQLAASVTEADGSASRRAVAWSSSDPSIATVSNTGRVDAVESGGVVITARAGGTADTLHLTAMRAPNPGGPQSTFLRFVSSPGEYIGEGQTQNYALGSGRFTGMMEANHARATYDAGGGTWWWVRLAVPQGQPLRVGTYQNATRWPFQAVTEPGLDFSGSGRGCDHISGRFTIHDVAYTHEGELQRLHATFRQYCNFSTKYLDGEVALFLNPLR